MKYEITVDGKAAQLSIEGDHFRYQRANGDVVEHPYSIAAASEGTFSILLDGRSYTATLLGRGEVSVNGRVFPVEVFDPRSMRGRKAAGVTEGRQTVAAPMPGRVIRVLVEAGQEVEAGQGLIVVEAMKMQNEMKSPKAGRVAEVRTKDGATVLVGDTLIVIE
jgi:biotin carboxyl carrier protein